MRIALLIPAACLSLCSCSGVALAALAGGLAGLAGNTGSLPATAPGGELLLFGGDGHKTFLGCLNCSESSGSSVRNSYSEYGSRYSSTSISNAYSDFGSKYSSYSACNPYASDPPVIVDRNGNYYGRLTVSQVHPDRVKNSAFIGLLAAMCQR